MTKDTMNLTNLTSDNLKTLHKLYQSNEYPIWSRHFSDFLNQEQFLEELSTLGSLLAVSEGDVFKGLLTVSLKNKPKLAHISLLLLKEHQHKGLAPKAILQIMDYLFKGETRRVVVTVSSEDERTTSLLRKGHFTQEGKLIKSCYYNNKYYDETRFSLSREKYKEYYQNKKEV